MWLVYALFMSMAFECNLRAHLIKVDFEKPIDTEQDLIDSGKDWFIPQGTSAELMYKFSDAETRKILYQRAMERQTIVNYFRGIMDPEAEKRMILEGCIIRPKIE